VRVDAHDYLVLPTEAKMGKRGSWVEVPRLSVPFAPVVEQIKLLVDHGLTSMMVLFNFLSKCITPLQLRVHSMWQYTEESDTTQLERGRGSGLSSDVMSDLLGKLTPNSFSVDFITPSPPPPRPGCAPMCSAQPTRTWLLRELLMLDDIGVTMQ
jgi:hypothetical protein